MCGTCGCSSDAKSSDTSESESQRHRAHDHSDAHDHAHDHAHVHSHGHSDEHTTELGRLVLGENERLAALVRERLAEKGIAALNLVSSPGSGKTALLEATLRRLVELGLRPAVLVGDLATDRDALRLQATGAPAVQITTGTVCHLDAHMVIHGLERLDLDAIDVLFLENVGNLVCPAAFDLGEDVRVVLSSTTEGEDKPLKYPTIFDGAHLALVTKMDLAEVLEVDLAALHSAIHDVAPDADVVDLSSKSGLGMDAWIEFVRATVERKRAALV